MYLEFKKCEEIQEIMILKNGNSKNNKDKIKNSICFTIMLECKFMGTIYIIEIKFSDHRKPQNVVSKGCQ